MENTNEAVFRSWTIGENIGAGTDGRVSYISKVDGNGETVTAALKTIFFHVNRNESKDFNLLGKIEPRRRSEIQQILESVTGNIDLIMDLDGGKRFVKYEEYEVKPSKDGFVLYIRMEQMRSLESLLTKFSLTQEEAIQIGISICRSLIRCRKFGYVYPSIKPENILFDERGRCKLGDFGSFSCLEPEKASLAYKKSEYYMAPEFIETGKINTTCDTYALGLVLYMLTNRGRLPFAEPYPQVVTATGLDNSKRCRLENQPFSAPVLASPEFFELIRKACAFNPQDRYLTPSQMLADLKNVAEGRPLEKPEYEEIYSNDPEAAPMEIDEPEEPYQEQVEEIAEDVFQEQPSSGNAVIDEVMSNAGITPPDLSSIPGPGEKLSIDDILAKVSRKPQAEQKPQPQPKKRVEEPVFEEAPKRQERKAGKGKSIFEDANPDVAEDDTVEEEPQPVSLKEKIKIPNILPHDYARGRKQSNVRPANQPKKRFYIGDLPQSKKERGQTGDIKKLIAIVAAIILVFVLLCSSCSIRSKHKKEETESLAASQSLEAQNNGGNSETLAQIVNNDTVNEETSGELSQIANN